GSWRTVFVTLDPLGSDTVDLDPSLKTKVRDHLEKFRLAGYDLEVDDPRYVSLEVELAVCVKRGYFGADIEQALLEVFSNRVRADGTLGLFHPDRFSFGEPVYLSPLVQAVLAVDGVDSVRFVTFQRQGKPDQGAAIKAGRILLDRLEIARLDNDPNFPEHGTFRAIPQGASLAATAIPPAPAATAAASARKRRCRSTIALASRRSVHGCEVTHDL